MIFLTTITIQNAIFVITNESFAISLTSYLFFLGGGGVDRTDYMMWEILGE